MIQKNTLKSTLLETQIDRLFRSSISGTLTNIFAAWLIFLLVQNTSQHDNAWLLGVSITLITFFRTLITSDFIRSPRFTTNTYLSAYFILTLMSGVCWGLFEYTQVTHDNDVVRNLIFLINFGMIAGSIPILSMWMPAYLAYVIPQATGIFLVFINLDFEGRYYIAFAFLIFIGLMVSTSVNLNRSRRNEIELTLKNNELIENLNEEIGEKVDAQRSLEKSKTMLEITVEERTRDLTDTNLYLESVIEKKEIAEESLQYLAYHDELTGLPNKNLLIDRINQSIKISSRDDQQMAILFLDLDRFKTINDSLGHRIGDELLKEVSERIKNQIRKHDTISRNGGDEFVIVLEKLKNHNEAVNVAKKVIKQLIEPFTINSHNIHIGASIGISIYPGDGDTPMILLRNADTAMYKAKKEGGNLVQFYDASMSNQLRDRLELENALHTAIDKNEFYMVYQPQVYTHNNKLRGVESLMRWNNAKSGEISPDRFIPLLEETGLIYSVGNWVVTQVVDFIAAHPENDFRFSINLSVLQCGHFEFINFLKEEINRTGITPSLLEFEITESLLVKDFGNTKLFLEQIHKLGCTIALDDFGTGYTSMTYLVRLPIDVIKIDKTFVQGIHEEDNNLEAIVRSIINMSDSLGMENVFEGVETKQELSAIRSMGGDIIQGYLYSKPMTGTDLTSWVKDRNSYDDQA
ncbi:MAG: EAL domain-containing protein [Proteobacteria bacterium]|nr:EAL domain-containing protein [Pseudomonadota bacterium]